MRLPSVVVVVITLAAILAPHPASAARLRYGAGDPSANEVAQPAPVRGDPDIPMRATMAPPAAQQQAQAPRTILSPCSMCEESNGNAAGACMLCGVLRRFASLGGW